MIPLLLLALLGQEPAVYGIPPEGHREVRCGCMDKEVVTLLCRSIHCYEPLSLPRAHPLAPLEWLRPAFVYDGNGTVIRLDDIQSGGGQETIEELRAVVSIQKKTIDVQRLIIELLLKRVAVLEGRAK